jgi:hypothetical protein
MKGVAVTLPRLTGLLALLALAFATIGADAVPDASDPALPEVTDTRLRDLPENAGMLRTFGPGEELVYAVKFGPIRAGTATLSVVGVEWANGGRCYRLKSTVRSTGFFSKIFHVDDLTESWMDIEELFSRRYVRIVNEGSYHRHDAVQIDQQRNLAFYFPKGDSMPVEPRTQDVLSVLYYARGLPLEVGESVIIPGHVDRKNSPVEIRVLKREEVKVPAGVFRCGVVEPILKAPGLFKNEGRITLWVSDDDLRIPVIVKTKVKVGSITAVLESYRPGTRLPLVTAGSTQGAATAPAGGATVAGLGSAAD